MDDRTLEVFNDSLSRCQSNPDFMSQFYDLFLASSPLVKEKFATTDFQKQNRMLKASLFMVMSAFEGAESAEQYLAQIAERHSSQDLDIGPELYGLWLDSLLLTVKQVDPRFTTEVGKAWRDIMDQGIKYMISKY